MFIELSSFSATLISIIATLMALFIAAPFHEFAHAFAARKEGDYTAVAMRRYTLAPHAHFDLFGFVCIFLFGFGWAKPVPVDSRNFKRGKKSEFVVSVAGILTNFVLGAFFMFVYLLLVKNAYDFLVGSYFGILLINFLSISISLNFMLAFFNLLPIYPLDGYRIIDSFCKKDNAFLYFMRTYSTIIYLIFIFTGAYTFLFENTMGYVVDGLFKFFSMILGM